MPINAIHYNRIMLTDIIWCLMRENQKVRKYFLPSDVVITWDIDRMWTSYYVEYNYYH